MLKLNIFDKRSGIMHKRLYIPGPVEVSEDVLAQMSKPMIGHRTKDATKLQQDISEKLQKVMGTKNTIVGTYGGCSTIFHQEQGSSLFHRCFR